MKNFDKYCHNKALKASENPVAGRVPDGFP